MEGFLAKRGKRIGSRVKRYMRLQGDFLSNHHAPPEPPTWRVNIKHAVISCNVKKNRILLDLYGNKLELFADSAADCQLWFEALTTVQNKHTAGKENLVPQPITQTPALVNLHSDNAPSQQSNQQPRPVGRTSDLAINFKVVKPKPGVSREPSNSSDQPHDSQQPLTVNGQVYEETPASMIFKQFNFPPK